MNKRIKANLYTEEKMGRNKRLLLNAPQHNYLFSHGRYRTKITANDLTVWFVKGLYYRHPGYLSAKGVVSLLYQPNYVFNHMFKDDFLYISYDKPIVPVPREQSVYRCEGFDEYIYGWEIVSFINAAQKYSSYDITDILAEIEKKRQWFQKTYPEHYRLEVPDDILFGGNVFAGGDKQAIQSEIAL